MGSDRRPSCVLVAVVVGLVLVDPRLDDDDESGTDTTASDGVQHDRRRRETSVRRPTPRQRPSTDATTPAVHGAGAEITYPLSFAQATEQGIADTIDWGDRCDTSTGRLAVPDFFAQPCFAPFTGDNGGATAPGVTADEITIVYYEGQETDPIIAYITDAIKVDDTNGEQFATMKELVRYYETYFELYGRTVNLVTFEGTGSAHRRSRRTCRRRADRRGVQAVRRVRWPGADQCVRRRAGRPPGHLHRLHARPAAVVLQRSRSVRVGPRRQPDAEARTTPSSS